MKEGFFFFLNPTNGLTASVILNAANKKHKNPGLHLPRGGRGQNPIKRMRKNEHKLYKEMTEDTNS